MKTVLNFIRRFLEMEKYVTERREKEILRTQRIVAAIASVGFLIFSVINISQDSDLMLVATLGGSVALAVAYGLSFVTKNGTPLRWGFSLVLGVLIPIFILTAGNDGFAALWVVLVSYIVMNSIDFRTGFILNVFYFLFLTVVFLIPGCDALFINANAPAIYGEEFLKRFPFFFLINFAFATYIIGSIRVYQYRLLEHQAKLEDLSIRDLNTNLYNRNAYIHLCNEREIKAGQAVTVVYMDANGLHELNNEKGHAAGDLMLHTIADVAKEYFGEKSTYRLGGDEFVSFSLDLTKAEAEEKTDLVVKKLEGLGYSVSAGLVWTNTQTNITDITTEANTIMLKNKAAYYSAKQNDRRRRASDN